MTPDVSNYADFFLRRLVHSFEKPYDPDRFGESALSRLTNKMVLDSERDLGRRPRPAARCAARRQRARAPHPALVRRHRRQRASSRRANSTSTSCARLLYMQRRDPRIDQRVRQYLHGRQLTPIAHEAVCALDPNTRRRSRLRDYRRARRTGVDGGSRRARVLHRSGGRPALLRQCRRALPARACAIVIQIANRLTNSIIVISCLEDFYGQVRGVVAQSYIDRIEKSGPVLLREGRTVEEARLIISQAPRASGGNLAARA